MKKVSLLLALALLLGACSCAAPEAAPAVSVREPIQTEHYTEPTQTEPPEIFCPDPDQVVIFPFSENDLIDAGAVAEAYLRADGRSFLHLDYDPVMTDCHIRQELAEDAEADEELLYPCRISFAVVSETDVTGISIARRDPLSLWSVRQEMPAEALSGSLLPQDELPTLDVDGLSVLAGYHHDGGYDFYLNDPISGAVVYRHLTEAEAVTRCGHRSPDAVWHESTWQTCPPVTPEPGDTAPTYNPALLADFPADELCEPITLLEKWMAVEGLSYADLDARDCRQLLLTVARSSLNATTVNLCFERRDDGAWQPVQHLPQMDGWVGSNGIFHDRRRNTYTSPAGLWAMGLAFGIKPEPEGVKLPWRNVTENSDWVGDESSKYYNTWQERDDPTLDETWRTDPENVEHLMNYKGAYDYALTIRFNCAPYTIPNRGNAIFLHCSTGPTGGCVGLSEADMISVLQWLDPHCNPYILITGHQ